MSSSNCCFLTCIQISQEADQVVWYSHHFQNFPQYIVMYIVKGFGIVNKAEIDVFLDISCFFEMGVERGERARHQTLSGSEWFQGTPRAGVGGSEGPREIVSAHHITLCQTGSSNRRQLKDVTSAACYSITQCLKRQGNRICWFGKRGCYGLPGNIKHISLQSLCLGLISDMLPFSFNRYAPFYLYQIRRFRAWSKSAAKWTTVLFLSLP